MTPEEKLLALIQQDKRPAVSATPQEKLLALIEQDKRNPAPAVPVPPVVVASPAPAAPPPAPVQPVSVTAPVPSKADPTPVQEKSGTHPRPLQGGEPGQNGTISGGAETKEIPKAKIPSLEGLGVGSASVVANIPVKSMPVAAAAPVLAKPAPVVVAPPVELPKTPLVVLPPASAPITAAAAGKPAAPPTQEAASVIPPQPVKAADIPAVETASLPATQQPNNTATASSPLPLPLQFPSIRISGVTVTNRVLAAMVMLLIVAVFYSVAGTQRSIDADIQRQMSGVGEMAVIPLAIADETVPSVEVLLEKVGSRNFFSPKLSEKGKSGTDITEPSGAVKDLKLVAVSLDATTASESMAIIKTKADSKTHFVKMGESVGDTGFVLTKVLADRIVLKQRKQEFELK